MDPFLLANIIGLVATEGPKVMQIWSEATSNDSFTTKAKVIAPNLFPLLEQVGAATFPAAAPALHAIGGLITALPQATGGAWLQTALNVYLGTALTSPLVVDGIIGKKTIAAVALAQAKLGIKQDGIAGMITRGLLDAAVQLINQKVAA